MYNVYHMKNLSASDVHPEEIDALILFLSQEERCLTAFNKIFSSNAMIEKVLALSFSNSQYTGTSLEIDTEKAFIDKDLYNSIIITLKIVKNYIHKKNVIGIDITCMPTPLFTQLINFIYTTYPSKKIIIYYTEPLYYSLNNLFEYSGYIGEIDIKAIPGYEGETSQSDDILRAVFYIIGFELPYLHSCIDQEVNPDRIIPINGFPSFFPKYKDISLINNGEDFYSLGSNIVYSEANNPFETYNQMLTLQETNTDYCIDIIPAGSKPMALGACLFALKNTKRKCRLIFPFPADYNLGQSVGSGITWEYKL